MDNFFKIDRRILLADDDFVENHPETIGNGISYDLNDPQSNELSTLEKEIMLLATNFLLYVALLIILYFVCQNYFPWTVEGFVAHLPRQSADFESDLESEETQGKGSNGETNGATNETTTSAGKGANIKTGNLLFQDSDEESESESESGPLVPSLKDAQGIRRKSFVPMSLNHTPQLSSSSSGDHTPYQTDSPAVVMKRLLMCAVGLITTFVIWGLLQERMLTRRYPRIVGDYFEYTYFLVFTNRLWSLLFSSVLMHRQRRFRWPKGVLIQDLSYSAVSNMLSSWCQYEALKYVTFPAQTLFKSFKILPVMLMGKVSRREREGVTRTNQNPLIPPLSNTPPL
jgi:hypothetical protein